MEETKSREAQPSLPAGEGVPAGGEPVAPCKEDLMLWTIAVIVILAILWLLGLASSYTTGGFIPLLLVIALALVLIRIIQGQRTIHVRRR